MMNWLQTRISQELGPEYGAQLWMDAQENIRLYAYYQGVGQAWNTPQGLDYRPNKTTVNHTKRLIDKVSGFMFSRAPEITLQPMGGGEDNARRVRELERHVRALLADEPARRAMGRCAAATAARFSEQAFALQAAALYHRAIIQKQAARAAGKGLAVWSA